MAVEFNRPCGKTIVELMRERVYFMYYQDQNLYYKTESGFVIVIPIVDCGTMNKFKYEEDRAVAFMRWLRPQYQAATAALNPAPEIKNPMSESTNPTDYVGSSPDGFRGDHSSYD